MSTFHIHIKGRVQGVGFRPFVYQTARKMGLKGWVCNATNGVHIRCSADNELIDQFYLICLSDKPHLAQITDATITEAKDETFEDFEIVESKKSDLELSLSPDFALCDHCRNELSSPADRRHQYAFITCTHCGPRYSILTGLPYDRPYTIMDSFSMCPSCQNEYIDPLDRRYFSQTNSCSFCGIQIKLRSSDGKEIDSTEPIAFIKQKLEDGNIIAVKGIGGFLLLCDATSAIAITTLRGRKKRPSKPFAVLFHSISEVENQLELSKPARDWLTGHVSPIVLLPPRKGTELCMEEIAPGLEHVGAMIPYAPILELISSQSKTPLIATSANLSGAPIVHGEDISGLFQLADYVLDHNRPITFPQDDSVVRLSPVHQRQIILRRSRGLAPSLLAGLDNPVRNTLALGAEMKGTFGICVGSNTFLSQYLGSMSSYDNQLLFEKVLNDFQHLVHLSPEQIVVDKHPGYFTHQLGKELAMKANIPLIEVQHHKAHFAAILHEHNLMESDRVLGVIWDGTGFGTDGQSWGGEFFEYGRKAVQRISHLAYFNNLSQDRMALDNRLCALSLLSDTDRNQLQAHFSDAEWDFYTKAIRQENVMTSSMGRVFDAVAFLAGINYQNSFEGQSAMLLEQDARRAYSRLPNQKPYGFEYESGQISLKKSFNEILLDREDNRERISLRFHLTLVQIIKSVAARGNYGLIAFSGGVFQNGLLADLITNELDQDFELFFHEELSPNDENIAYGQLAYVQFMHNREKENLKELEPCV